MSSAAQCASAADDTCLDVRLQCPRCRANPDGFSCARCGLILAVRDGIVRALPPARAAHYARFIQDYERIRAAEGRGSESDDYYLGLPYLDASGRNSGQWRIRARSFDCLMRHVLGKFAVGHYRRVLDLGAGNCWMSFRMALAGYRPCAVDLLTNDSDGLGAGAHYAPYLPRLFPRFQAEMTHLPFQDDEFDTVIFNASFHYAEDAEAALGEALRCVRSGGLVIISDTPWYSGESSGQRMVAERQADFLRRFGTASDSLKALEYLTDERLALLAERFAIRWRILSPRYGLRWAMRPWARLLHRREPSRFRIYVARKLSS